MRHRYSHLGLKDYLEEVEKYSPHKELYEEVTGDPSYLIDTMHRTPEHGRKFRKEVICRNTKFPLVSKLSNQNLLDFISGYIVFYVALYL